MSPRRGVAKLARLRTLRLVCLGMMGWSVAQAAEPPQRVVSLAPSMTEMLLELGVAERLVGVLDAGERPTASQQVPSVGRYGQLDVERLLAVQPDLILLWPGAVPPAQRELLRGLGLLLYSAEPHTLDELIQQIDALAERLGVPDKGRAYTAHLHQRLAALRERYRRAQPIRVFYQVWDAPLYTLGGQQVISDALRTCGARNLFDDVTVAAPLVSVEAVLARRPQVIVGGSAAQLERWRTLVDPDTRLILVPDAGLERPSGQMIEATAQLCAALDPASPTSPDTHSTIR